MFSLTNTLNALGNRITNLGAPSALTDAVRLGDLNNAIAGVDWKPPVRALASSNITLSGTQTVDGLALNVGDRVLCIGQTTASQNLIYVVASGTWTVAPDSAALKNGDTVEVASGGTSVGASGAMYRLTTQGAITVGTTSLSWSPTTAAGQTITGGNGIAVAGGVVSANVDGATLVADGTSLRVNSGVFMKAYSYAIPAGSTSVTVTLSSGSLIVLPMLFDVSTAGHKLLVQADVDIQNATTLVLTFGTAPVAGQYELDWISF